MNIKRIQTLIEALKVLPDSKFDFKMLVTEYDHKNQCGTVCCAAGHLPAIDSENWEWILRDPESDVWSINYKNFKNAKDTTTASQLAEYFDIPVRDALRVFLRRDAYFIGMHHDITRQHVIAALDSLIYNHNKYTHEG